MMKWFTLTALMFLLFVNAFADKERPNEKYKAFSPNKKYFAVLTPSSSFGVEGTCKVYASKDSLQKKLLWKTNWFARTVFLSNDGKHIIRFGKWASDISGRSDLALAFYNKEKLLKEYKVSELVKDSTKLQRTVSHYKWELTVENDVKSYSTDFKKYTLTTVDNQTYTFEISSGKVINSKPKKNPTK